MQSDWSGLAERLRRASVDSSRFRPDTLCLVGLETRVAEDRYHWDGLKRPTHPTYPFVVFQVTLYGFGVYETRGHGERMTPGRAFAAVIPTAHRYFLPPDSPHWSFFWLLFRHPYMVGRIMEWQRGGGGATLEVAPDSPVVHRAADLYEGKFPDRYAEELALFAFVMEYGRHVEAARATRPIIPGEQLLEETRQFTRERLTRPADVSELASAHGMSRTRFSHHFRELTGEAPAHFMARVRLEEVARRLAQTDATLDAIARETGFADANHLCKAFRRSYGVSPGVYRRQVR